MIKAFIRFACGALILSVVLVDVLIVSAADRSPATLLCVRNASASRGYGFDEKRWLGVLAGPERSSSPPFEVSVTGKSGPKAGATLQRIFTGLDSETPTVREMEKGRKDVEFPSKIVSRLGDSVIILWTNSQAAANWAWLAHIDRRRHLAIVTSVYDGSTYSGGELETMDCR